MTATRRLWIGVGLLSIAGGGLLLALPAVGSGLVPPAVATLLTVAVGAGAVVIAGRRLFESDEPPVRLPSPEFRPRYRTPGSSFAALLDDVSTVGRRAVDESDDWDGDGERVPRERAYAALHDLAIAVLARTEGLDAGTAAERLSEGRWTDDAEAAAFFAEGLRPPLPRRASLPWVRPELPVARRARHVVAELASRVAADAPDPSEADTADPNEVVETTVTDAESGSYWPTADLPRERSTGRTRRVTVAVLLTSAVGVVAGLPGTVLTAAFGVALAGAASVWQPDADLAVSRSVSTRTPAPGETVEVTVTVRNVGESTVPDLRLLDGVPAGLGVASGTARFATALRPGKAASTTYTVEAVPGTHAFEPPVAVVGDVAGARETVQAVEDVDGPATLDCGFERRGQESEAPRPQVTLAPGRRTAGVSGAGVEFDALREYRPGDPPGRIDWNHRAKTGDLATVEFEEPRRPRVVFVLDARRAAYVAETPHGVPAPRHGATAAFAVADGLFESGVPTGLATVGATDCWLHPTTGSAHREALRERLAGDRAVPWTAPGEETAVRDAAADLAARLSADAQVVLVTPLCDDGGVSLARRLDAAGHRVSVVSPDCTVPSSVGGAYGHLTRRERVATLRSRGVPVRNWDPTTPSSEVSHADG
ncbi:DUF58 domain-containing protein [Haloarcula salina]|uniref:DUF58 domain-containing protein n=1 Tax=Haloarcula salina TaxID=1429914 RepID=UPI003C6FC199